MNRFFQNIIPFFVPVFLSCPLQAQHPSKWVNPFIGTGGHGHTFPGSTYPFGACQLSPDTRLEGWDGCSGYHYSDSVIYGFSHTHLSGTGCSDYGDILLMPVIHETAMDQYQYASLFHHQQEKASPGFYSVLLEKDSVFCELTSTLHGGIHRYTYPGQGGEYVVLDLKHRDQVLASRIEKVDDYTLRGYRFSKAWAQNQKVFFEIRFSKPIQEIRYEAPGGSSLTSFQATEQSLHVLLRFKQESEQNETQVPLLVKVAISGVDEEGASNNLKKEMTHWNFEQYMTEAEAAWDNELNKIKVKKSARENTIFYTSLYHAMIHPSLYSDVDGRYRGRDDRIHETHGTFDYYTVFSLWDTYRSLHPLLNIIDPKRTRDFIHTFIRQYEEGGRLPVWELSSNETNCMIGYHVVSVIWNAYASGIRDFNQEKAFEAMKAIATSSSDYYNDLPLDDEPVAHGSPTPSKPTLYPEARKRAADADALESYMRYGYVRCDDSHESVSKTLEYSYNDWCIAQMAAVLHHSDDYAYYMKRSTHWMNVLDPGTGFMRARKNGTLYEPFSPYTVDNNYTEANSWQYSFYVPHDIKTLKDVQGGEELFEKKLDALFEAETATRGREQADITGLIGQYAHGNEPSHAIAYLYRFCGKPEKTQALIDRILDSFYTDQPDGLIGNEDCGQMSAWYVMSALGLYEPCPGMATYDTIDARFQWKNAVANPKKNDLPPYQKVHTTASPALEKVPRIFSQPVALHFMPWSDPDPMYSYRIHYSLNHGAWELYDSLHEKQVNENSSIRFYASSLTHGSVSSCSAEKGCGYDLIENIESVSPVQECTITRLPSDRQIILHSTFNPSYHAGGASGLMDGIYGKLNWRAGDWQGYQGQDVEVVMELNESKSIHEVGAHFLEDQNSWIFYPKSVAFFIGEDSVHWKKVADIPTGKSDHNLETTMCRFGQVLAGEKARYIKMIARNFGPMPQWHEGRGAPTFIFIDELEVK